ncbi:hypothetical protein D3C81_1590470 [compost metagenome]
MLCTLPALRLSSVPALIATVWPLSVPPWLFRVCAVLMVRLRLAVRLLPVLSRFCAVRLRSPLALRLVSALTPASMAPALVSCPPALRVRLSRAARVWRLVRLPWVCTLSAVPA